MKKYTITILIILLTVLFSMPLMAQNESLSRPDPNRLAKFILAEAQIAYEENDYPLAFLLAQEAVDARKAESAWSVNTLETELRKPSAQKIGKDINQLLYFFKNRKSNDVVQVIERALLEHTVEYFDFSIDNVLEYIRISENYPEAEYLLAKLYYIEGELSIAESYFYNAYEYRSLLDVSDEQYDVLYSIADLYAIQKKWNEFEEVLLLIAAEDDSYYENGEPSAFIRSITTALKNGMSVDRFFLLFRNDYYKSLKAWYYLTYYYDNQGNEQKALETALLFATSSLERIDEVLEDRDIHYTYTSLNDFFKQLQLFYDVSEWAKDNDVWEGFYNLGKICSELGYNDFAQGVFLALAMECPVRQWRELSEKALQS